MIKCCVANNKQKLLYSTYTSDILPLDVKHDDIINWILIYFWIQGV